VIFLADAGVFSELGLTETESAVFAQLVSLGSATGSKLASHAGLQKSVAYFVLGQLVQKGFASFVVINNRREFRPIEIELLKGRIDARKKEFARHAEGMLSAVLVPRKDAKRASFRIFEGWDGMKAAFDDILKSEKDGHYVVFAVDTPQKVFPRFRRFIKGFHMKRVEKGISCRLLVSSSLRSTIGKDRRSEKRTAVKFVSSEHVMPMAVNVYADKAMLAVWGDPPLAMTIESKAMSDSFRAFFELLWASAKP